VVVGGIIIPTLVGTNERMETANSIKVLEGGFSGWITSDNGERFEHPFAALSERGLNDLLQKL
jgi:hypothetical protein